MTLQRRSAMRLPNGYIMSAITAVGSLVLALPFILNDYIIQVAIISITYSMLGLAFALTLQVGMPRFDAAAWWGVGAYATAMIMLYTSIPFWVATLLAGLICLVISYVVFRFAIPRGMMVFLMFGMVLSLAFQQMFGTLTWFGGWSGTPIVPPASIAGLEFTSKAALYYLGLAFIIINVIIYQLLYSSRVGKAWRAVGASPQLAGSLGIDVVKYRLGNVLVGSFFIGLAGGYFIAFSRSAIPQSFSFHASVMVMMYVIVGGIRHKIGGPIVGALVLTFIPEAFRVASKYELIVSSGITALIIIFVPMGVVGLGVEIWRRARQRSAKKRSEEGNGVEV
jgi:branched-chain amino acid transport system permease protein